MDPRLMEQRYLAKRRPGRRWAIGAGAVWLVLLVLFFGFAGGGPNFGLVPLMLAAPVSTGVALFQLSQARDANPARYSYR